MALTDGQKRDREVGTARSSSSRARCSAGAAVTMRLDVGGFALRAAASGVDPPPAFACLHGLVDTLEIWDAVAPALSARGRLVRFDQRGHGESDAPPGAYGRDDLGRDCAAVLERSAMDRAILVGHSMGGVVAMATALRFPERVAGLVLIATTSQASERVAAWYERIARAGEADGVDGIRRAIHGEGSARPITGDARGIARVTRMLASLHPDPLTPRLREIASPALVLVGEKDPMGTKASEILARELPCAKLEVVPGCGHWVHVDAPDAMIASLDTWLAADGPDADGGNEP